MTTTTAPITSIDQLSSFQRYSYADYRRWNFKERVELIQGQVLEMSPAPNTLHQRVATALTGIIWSFFQNKPCQVFTAPFDVRLPRKAGDGETQIHTVVQPDLCVICDPDKLDERGCVGAPDLVVEIISPGNSRKEMKDKFEVYEEAGVREYWIVNPVDKVVLVYVLDEQRKYIGRAPVVSGDELVSTIFPELKISLVELLGEPTE